VDFNLNAKNESYRARIRDFVEQNLLPLESDPDAYDEHENIALEHLEIMRPRQSRKVYGAYKFLSILVEKGLISRAWLLVMKK